MRAPRGEAWCREVLEVGPEAGPEEIRRAYVFLRALYAPDSAVLPPVSMDEFDPGVQARILEDVEAAHAELCLLVEPPPPPPPPSRPAPPEPGRILDGAGLRGLREAAGFSLDHLAAETSVRRSYLEALEEERFRDLPSAAVIVRGYLTAYLAALGAASDASVADYSRRFQAWQGK